jgi:hypothetical protein
VEQKKKFFCVWRPLDESRVEIKVGVDIKKWQWGNHSWRRFFAVKGGKICMDHCFPWNPTGLSSRGQLLTTEFTHRGEVCHQGWTLSPRGNCSSLRSPPGVNSL